MRFLKGATHPTVVAAAAGTMIAASAHAGSVLDSHIGIDVIDGQLSTQGWVSGEGYQGEQRVFAQMFNPGSFWTDDPGTNSVGGTFATPGAIGFNILEALWSWNESEPGFDVAAETLNISFGPGGAGGSVFTGDGFVPGFTTAVRDENSHPDNPAQWGRHHVHYDFTLHGANDDDPADGIYLLAMEFFYEPGEGNDVTYGDSKPFWVVFGLNRTEAEIAAAVKWVEMNIVPAPGAIALLAAAGLLGVRRRRS